MLRKDNLHAAPIAQGGDAPLVFSDARLDLVEQGLDVALRAGELADSSLVARKIGQARWAPFAHPDYLKRAPALRQPKDLTQHATLCFSPLGRDSWTLMRGKSRTSVPLRSAFAANDMRLIRQLAIDGQGVALLPDYVCRREVGHGQLVPLLPGWHAPNDPNPDANDKSAHRGRFSQGTHSNRRDRASRPIHYRYTDADP